MLTAADRAQLAAERVQRDRIQREEDVKTVLSTGAGRRLVAALIEQSGVRIHSLDIGSKEPVLAMAYHEGRRSVGLELDREAQRVAPLSYAQMEQERINKENERAAIDAAHAVPGPGDRKHQ